jgi:hypothetical protein
MVRQPGFCHLTEWLRLRSLPLAALPAALATGVDAVPQPVIDLHRHFAGIRQPDLGIGPDREGLAHALPAVVLQPGLGAGPGDPEIEAITVVVLAARSGQIRAQSLNRLVTEQGAQRQNALGGMEVSRSAKGLSV